MDRILDFTDVQKIEIRKMLVNRDQAIKDIIALHKGNPEEMRAALQQLQKRIEAAIVALLTPEQLIKWRRWKG
jgi:hypothetical protein